MRIDIRQTLMDRNELERNKPHVRATEVTKGVRILFCLYSHFCSDQSIRYIAL